jgi:ribosomal protein S18 acetylase RimI-like enzyme
MVEEMLVKFEIEKAASAVAIAGVRALLQDYAASLPVDLTYQRFDRELAELDQVYAPPSGALFLAKSERGDLAGCVGLKQAPLPRHAEMKRLYVVPASRGRQLGRRLVSAAMSEARALGYGLVLLDTLPTMGSARRMYEAMGFQQIEPYYGPTPAGTIFMSCSL